MNARDTMALLGYAEMLDDTVDLRNESRGMNGGDPVRTLMNEVQHLESEIVLLKIAHLRRMAEVLLPKLIEMEQSWRTEMARRSKGLPYQLPSISHRRYLRLFRLSDAIEAKITELKESQCSTKS